MIAGVICSVSLALVGVFPMNKIKPHGKAAIAYFRTGLGMVGFFSLAIALQPNNLGLVSRWAALAGLPPILVFGIFLLLTGRAYQKEDGEEPLSTEGVQRLRFWHLAAVEWLIFLTVLLWFFLIALGLR
jgi:hypothetical protein